MAFTFRRLAGSFQVQLDSFDDLLHVAEIPDAHWVATAAPIGGLNCDSVFLASLDKDGNGRARAEELKVAIRWTAEQLADRSDCVPGSETLVVAKLAPGADDLRAAAKLTVDTLGLADGTKVTLAQVREVAAALKKRAANGDGIVPVTSVEDPAQKQLVTDILAHFPGADDAGGDKGVDQATLDAFLAARDAAVAWLEGRTGALTWGEASIAMARHVRELRPKVDEYFLLCRLVASQPETAASLRITPDRAAGLLGDAGATRVALDQLPLAPPDADGILRWLAVYRSTRWEAVMTLRNDVVLPILGDTARDGLTEAQWSTISAAADAVLAWADAESQHAVAALGLERLRAITPELVAGLVAAIATDAALAAPLGHLAELERLVLYQRWLFEFANNFVTMPNLYRRTRPAIFEQGTLVMAGRNFSLSLLVNDRGTHSAMATQSLMHLMYLTISNPDRSFEVVVPVTSGTSQGLYVGKRGIFHAVDGREYDATVVSILSNPVSIWEAIIQPFERLGTMISSRLDKWQQEADAEFSTKLTTSVDATQKNLAAATAAGTAVATAPAAPPKPPSKPMDPSQIAGVAAAGGLAFAAIGSTVAGIAGFLGGDGFLDTAVRVVGLVAIILSPFAIVAWWKLRRRNVSGLLEAGGWALNDRLKLSRKLGLLFTRRPARPPGTRLDWRDETLSLDLSNIVPDEEETFGTKLKRLLLRALAVIVVAAILLPVSGYMDEFLGLFGIHLPHPEAVEAAPVEGAAAPVP